MSIINKAQELADLLVASQEFEALQAAEKKMKGDTEAQAILQEFQGKQRALHMMQVQGQEVTDEAKSELEDIQKKMKENETIKEYMDAQSRFNQVMQTINQVISSALQGDEGCCGSSDGCSGGCC